MRAEQEPAGRGDSDHFLEKLACVELGCRSSLHVEGRDQEEVSGRELRGQAAI